MANYRLAVRLVATATLLLLLPAARCQQRAASLLPWPAAAAGGSHAVVKQPAEQDAVGTDDKSEFRYGDYDDALEAAAAAWAAQAADDQLPSAERAPAGWPSRGLLEQLLQRPDAGQQDVGSLLGALLTPAAGGGGGGAPGALAALLTRATTTTTTVRPTRIFDRFVIRDGNPFATMRPKGTTARPTAAVTQHATATAKTTEADSEVEKFDAGFQIFSQMFGGGNGVGGATADAFADAPTTPAPTAAATPAVPLGWPFYTTPRPSTAPPPLPASSFFVDKIDLPPPQPTRPPVPYYYNVDQTPAPPAASHIKLGELLRSVTQLVKSDGPSMLAALGDAVTYIQEGNVMGLLQGVVPVFSRATPVVMRMISAVAPAIEKSDAFGGATLGPPARPGLGGLFGSFAGLFGGGRRRPLRPQRRPLNKAGVGFNRPYYFGQVVGSGMKLVTYLINHGTTVVRARQPDAADLSWLADAVGADNAEFLRLWLQQQAAGRS